MNTNNFPDTTRKYTSPYFGSHLEPFSFHEGFSKYTDISCNGTDLNTCAQNILKYQLIPINDGITQYSSQLNNLNQGIMDLSKNIVNYNQTRGNMLNPNPNTNRYYDYNGNVLFPPPTLQDGLIHDNYEISLYENTLYIAGTLAMATLLIGSIILARD